MAAGLEPLKRAAEEAYERTAARLDRTRAGRFALDVLRGASTVLHHLRLEPVMERAGALSYATVLALVPLLALSLAVASAVGHDWLHDALRDFAFAFLAPGIRQSSLAELETFIDRASSGGVLSASGAALLVTALMLLRNIESAINRIWGVTESRTWPLRVAVYVTVLLFGPVLLGASLAATHAMREAIEREGFVLSRTALALAPFVSSVAGLTVLYKVAPNAEVQKRSAFAGALVAGVLFEVMKHGYVVYAQRSVHYSRIYGSLAAVPLFLVWVYLSWMVVLFGVRVAYAVQNAGSWGFAALPQTEGARARLAARTLLSAALAQKAGRSAPGLHTVARESGADESAVAESARLLRSAGLLTEDAEGGLVPARPLELITLADVAAAVRHLGTDSPRVLGNDPASRAIAELFGAAERAGDQSLARMSFGSLVEPLLASENEAPDAAAG